MFPVESLKDIRLWASAKDTDQHAVDNTHYEFNLWFADKGEKCGIHNIHNFIEYHTQVYGLGIM